MFSFNKKVEVVEEVEVIEKCNYFISYNIFDINELPIGAGWVIINDIEKIKTSEDILSLEQYIETTQKLSKIVILNFIII